MPLRHGDFACKNRVYARGISLINPRGAAYACRGNSFRGGVSRRFTRRPKGQSTVEYVLIIAIIVLVVLVVGPQIAGAIRNQFNLVAGTIGSGTTGENFYEATELPDPENGTAFAVYSEDDNSLMFYKRRGVPKVGDMFNDRRVTEVYTGFEGREYGVIGATHGVPDGEEWKAWKTDVPWFGISNSVTRINVVDLGIAPRSLAFWFYRFSNLVDADLSNLDSTRITKIHYLFLLSGKLSHIKMPRLTSACTNCADAFSFCGELVSLELPPSDFSGCRSFWHMFYSSRKLTLDCSDWNVQVDVSHNWFNFNAPGVILPKVWQ